MFMKFSVKYIRHPNPHPYRSVIIVWASGLVSIPQVPNAVQDVLAAMLEKAQTRDEVVIIDCSTSSVQQFSSLRRPPVKVQPSLGELTVATAHPALSGELGAAVQHPPVVED